MDSDAAAQQPRGMKQGGMTITNELPLTPKHRGSRLVRNPDKVATGSDLPWYKQITLLPIGGKKREDRNMTQLQERTKVALYARSATDDPSGIQAQLENLKMRAERHGLEPVSQFTDMHGSREEFDRMMTQATSENPPFQVIMVYDLSRFTRSLADWTKWKAELEANGVRVNYTEEPVDNTPV